MTKSFKGQSARTTSDINEFITGRQLAAALVQPFNPQADSPLVAAAASPLVTLNSQLADYFLTVREAPAMCLCMICQGVQKTEADMARQLATEHNVTHLALTGDTADEPTLDVVVGGSVSGNIDFNGDTDNITVFLVAGQTYLISLRGTGATPINDSFLQMRDPTNAIISGVTDDDGGNDLYSISTYTATATGNYTIIAATFSNPGAPDLGGWTVDVRVQGADAIGDTDATSVALSLGTTFGFREAGTVNEPPIDPLLTGDLDRYRVELVEGHFYTFKVAGSADYTTNFSSPPVGTLDTFMYLTDGD